MATALERAAPGLSPDADQGGAQDRSSVGGERVGGTFTASTWRAAGEPAPSALKGDWGAACHTVTLSFRNDAWEPTAAADDHYYTDDFAW